MILLTSFYSGRHLSLPVSNHKWQTASTLPTDRREKSLFSINTNFGRCAKNVINNSGAFDERVSMSVAADAFTEIDLKADVAAFEIKKGSDFHVEYTFPSNFKCNVDSSDGKLKIEVKANDLAGLSFLGSNVKNIKDDYKITVFVPEGTNLDNFKADVDAGSICLNDMLIADIDIEGDASNVEMSNIEASETEINTDAGNIEIKNSSLGKFNVKADAGNIQLSKTTALDIVAHTDAGNIELKDATFKTGNFESSMGNVEIEGTFDSVDAECSLGAISIDAENDDARINANVDLGSIEINGKNIKGRSYNQ